MIRGKEEGRPSGSVLTKAFFMEGKTIFYVSFFSALIEAIGYDPQRALLEVRLSRGARVRQYENVPEDVWYHLRENGHPDAFYRRYICGHYRELNISG